MLHLWSNLKALCAPLCIEITTKTFNQVTSGFAVILFMFFANSINLISSKTCLLQKLILQPFRGFPPGTDKFCMLLLGNNFCWINHIRNKQIFWQNMNCNSSFRWIYKDRYCINILTYKIRSKKIAKTVVNKICHVITPDEYFTFISFYFLTIFQAANVCTI